MKLCEKSKICFNVSIRVRIDKIEYKLKVTERKVKLKKNEKQTPRKITYFDIHGQIYKYTHTNR